MQTGKSSWVGKIAVLAVLIAALVATAYYWESITFFVKLHGWDKNGPAKTVSEFLEAGKRGDQAAADRLLATRELQALSENGKWVGYFMVSNAGRMNYLFTDLAPAAGTAATNIEFVYIDRGAAMVTMPDSRGKGVPYRLEMIDNTWKITEIRGGRPA